MDSFEEAMNQLQMIKETIFSNLIDEKDSQLEILEFSQHLLTTKQWFVRASWAHKKQFMLSLIDDVRSMRTISLLLKSIWNCRPKDAVMSICQNKAWSSHDKVPMDHDRTVQPLSFIKKTMSDDRKWFHFLKPDFQIMVLTELLSMAGGPILWEVLHHTKLIYEKQRDEESLNILECVVINEQPAEKKSVVSEPVKKEPTPRKKSSHTQESEIKQTPIPGQALKEVIKWYKKLRGVKGHMMERNSFPLISGGILENNLAIWTTAVKNLKDSMKLEELEITYKDGTKRRMWKANRTKPEVDAVDFIQLLPSTISKCILSYLSSTQLVECARVNKYWSYLVDEMRIEAAARQKIDVELEKLRENMLRHDSSLGLLQKPEFAAILNSSARKLDTKSRVGAYKSKQYCYYPVKSSKKNKLKSTVKPIRKLQDLNDELERRGAADQNMWKWCENLLDIYKKFDEHSVNKSQRPQAVGLNFVCPASDSVKIPLQPPLVVDPTFK